MSKNPFRDLMYPPVTGEAFAKLRASDGAKRIDFADTHKNALKPFENGKSTFTLPFSAGIEIFFPEDLFQSKFGGTFRYNNSQDEHDAIASWIQENIGTIFIRSLATSAVAACSHVIGDQLSDIGALEKAAKYGEDVQARSKLIDILCGVYHRLYSPLDVGAVVAVPASKLGKFNLPTSLAAGLAQCAGIDDLSPQVSWNGEKPSLKEASAEERWGILEQVGMTVPNLTGTNVILLDDMYQSGATAHFIAGQLREAGANDIHILAVCKSRRDSDNR